MTNSTSHIQVPDASADPKILQKVTNCIGSPWGGTNGLTMEFAGDDVNIRGTSKALGKAREALDQEGVKYALIGVQRTKVEGVIEGPSASI